MVRMNSKHHINALQNDESGSTAPDNEMQCMTTDSVVSITRSL